MDRYAIALGKKFRCELIPGTPYAVGPELLDNDIVEARKSYVIDRNILRFLQNHPVKDIKKYCGAISVRKAAARK